MEAFEKAINWLNDLVWGWPMIVLILGAGILLTIRTKFLQVRKFKTSINTTIGPTLKSLGKKKKKEDKLNSISQFEAFATAISGTVGTGNIIGVTSAILTGGPGAVFWMWFSAFFGMVTNYSENVLGLYFRKKEKNGDLSGGAMYYIQYGLPKFLKWLSYLAAVFCLIAAVGMGGVQTNKISSTIVNAIPSASMTFVLFGQEINVLALVIGVVVAILLALIILGGIKRIGKVASFLVPFMSLIFMVMAIIIIFANIARIGTAFALIFTNIFSFKSAVGGFAGYAFSKIIQKGLARGVFSNEAGLGSSVIAHSSSETREPVKQGLWGIFEVFFDTFIICTLTALVILTTYTEAELYTGTPSDSAMAMGAFSGMFGGFGTVVFSIIMPLFAFTTTLAWSYYGEKAVQFLFKPMGEKASKIATIVFKVVYVALIVVSSVIDGTLIWTISDTANALMALPNLIAVVILSGLVAKITKNYFARKNGENVEPMLSAYPELNEQFKQELNDVAHQ